MADIADMVRLGWGDPGAQGSTAADVWRRRHISTLRHRGVAVSVNNDPNVQYVFRALIEFLTDMGVDLSDMKDDWGYANRDIRGFPGKKSYHSWGLAVDLDATKNPMGRRHTSFPEARTRKVAKSLGLRWGLDYQTRPDPMHFEVIVSKAQLAAIVRRLKTGRQITALGAAVGVGVSALVAAGLVAPQAQPVPKPAPTVTVTKTATPTNRPTSHPTSKPTVKPSTKPTTSKPVPSPTVGRTQTTAPAFPGKGLKVGSRGPNVRLVQQRLIALGYRVKGGADGWFGYDTETAVKTFQGRKGLRPDGQVGSRTWRALFGSSGVR